MGVGFKTTLESHHINHANSKLVIYPNYPELGIETSCINKITEKISINYGRLINQYKVKYQMAFSARFDKQNEYYEILDETELFINLKITHNLTETDFNNVDIRSPLE